VEAPQLARQARLATRANAQLCRAVNALERADDVPRVTLAAAADAIAELVQEAEPGLADRLREQAAVSRSDASGPAHHHLRSRPPARPAVADVGAQRDGADGGPPGWLDPRLILPGIFQHAWRADAELTIRTETDGILIEARLVPGADRRVLAHCRARLVDLESRSVIGVAPFRSLGGLRVRAEIQDRVLPGSAWVEIVDDETRPVSSAQLHHNPPGHALG
jgi:hypothetical protein